jgi:ribosomal protein S18 acetylase RimI-like enzyme
VGLLEPLAKDAESFEFAYGVKRAAMGPHVRPRWGWDEGEQRAILREKWEAKSCYSSRVGADAVGLVAIDERADEIELSEFYIKPSMHGRGIGSEVIREIFGRARAKGLPVRLRALKWNPAVKLYARHGFRVTGETEHHVYMEWKDGK